ncbi:MAG: nicotinate-nucleotide--dimethylbenzimidazole phosphoribosyltransferase [Chromatiales bacterium]|nr:nicotinate-nucleotide--dimethylbenzimidazole phosphoribosyltransferase [Chromatiales bacterium]
MSSETRLDWIRDDAAKINTAQVTAAEARQGQLTKPPGSLGQLEDIAIRLAGMQGVERPVVDRVQISIFAADHGIANEGVSAFPQEVTTAMIANFSQGGAAISVLAKTQGAKLEVIDVGAVSEAGAMPSVISQRVAAGTANFAKEPAMSEEQLALALQAGADAAERAQKEEMQLLSCGEMGIANTTSAAAIGAALLQRPAVDIAGPGTGLDSKGVSHKAEVIQRALELHGDALGDPQEVLRRLGGFEIAALTGAYIRAAQLGLPVLVDGFICTVAALVAVRINPSVKPWLMLTHASAEPGHAVIVEAFGGQPLIDLGMRLGEGSGAAICISILRLACQLHNNMATFAEAGVAEKLDD